MVNFMKRESAQPETPVQAEEPPMPEALTTESLAARGFTVLKTSGKGCGLPMGKAPGGPTRHTPRLNPRCSHQSRHRRTNRMGAEPKRTVVRPPRLTSDGVQPNVV